MRETKIRISKIRKSPNGPDQKQKQGMQFTQKNYIRKRAGAKQVGIDLRFRVVSDFPMGGADGFGDS